MGLEETKYIQMFGALCNDSKTLLQQTIEQNIISAYTERVQKGTRTKSWLVNQELNNKIINHESYYKRVFGHYYYPKIPREEK